MADLTEGDVEVDPELLELGDEVADEVVSDFKRNRTPWMEQFESKWTHDERRGFAQRAADLAFEQRLSITAACAVVGEEAGVHGLTVRDWMDKYGIESIVPVIQPKRRTQQWDLYLREELFDRMLATASDLLDLLNVRLQGGAPVPEGWNAATDLKTIAVAAAIAHDKRTIIEDLKRDRGLLEFESEELQSGLDVGRQRLIEMGGR